MIKYVNEMLPVRPEDEAKALEKSDHVASTVCVIKVWLLSCVQLSNSIGKESFSTSVHVFNTLGG